jgi:hypothetical protein
MRTKRYSTNTETLSTAPNGPDNLQEAVQAALSSNGAAAPLLSDTEQLDEYERIARDCILEEDEDEVSRDDEKGIIAVISKMPKFVGFRVNPATIIDLFGLTDADGLEKTVLAVSKEFAPTLEEYEDLRRVRFYETVSFDGVPRIVYNFMPDKDSRTPNLWLASKKEVMEAAVKHWVTMRSRRKLGKFTHQRCRRDYGEPRFLGWSVGEIIIHVLKKPGLLIESEDHPFYRKAADLETE